MQPNNTIVVPERAEILKNQFSSTGGEAQVVEISDDSAFVDASWDWEAGRNSFEGRVSSEHKLEAVTGEEVLQCRMLISNTRPIADYVTYMYMRARGTPKLRAVIFEHARCIRAAAPDVHTITVSTASVQAS